MPGEKNCMPSHYVRVCILYRNTQMENIKKNNHAWSKNKLNLRIRRRIFKQNLRTRIFVCLKLNPELSRSGISAKWIDSDTDTPIERYKQPRDTKAGCERCYQPVYFPPGEARTQLASNYQAENKSKRLK